MRSWASLNRMWCFLMGKKSGAKVRESPYFHNRKPAPAAAFTEFTTNTGV
jgi:hypothetical protein